MPSSNFLLIRSSARHDWNVAGDGPLAENAAIESLQKNRALWPQPGAGMSQQPRDWDKKLANIDRAMAESPPVRPRHRPPAGRFAAPAPSRSGSRRRRRFVPGQLTWFSRLLTVTLALALPFWPYDQSCGLRLVSIWVRPGSRFCRCPSVPGAALVTAGRGSPTCWHCW